MVTTIHGLIKASNTAQYLLCILEELKFSGKQCSMFKVCQFDEISEEKNTSFCESLGIRNSEF
jgi:hypothetical protein